jgi:hypothetical protein
VPVKFEFFFKQPVELEFVQFKFLLVEFQLKFEQLVFFRELEFEL